MEKVVRGAFAQVGLEAGLCAEEIDVRLRRASRLADVGQRAMAFYLAELQERGLCQVLGSPTAVAYAVRALGMARRTARELVMAGVRLAELRVIDEAFAAGRVPWSKVRRLCAVATPATEGEWLEVALDRTQDELEVMVRGTRRGDRPPADGGLPRARFRLMVELNAVQWQMWENARDKLRAEGGADDDVRDVDVMMEMLQLVLASDADGSVPGRRKVDGSVYRVVVDEEDGDEAAISDGATPPGMRARVFARDRHRCQNCGRRRGLHAHHVVWRSKGGPTQMDNLVTLCASCHGLVHEGFVTVEVAQCAGARKRRVAFVWRDGNGRRLDARWLLGPWLAQPRARLAQPSVAQGAGAPELDAKWLAAHLDWFEFSGGKLFAKARYREEVRRELDRGRRTVERVA